MTSVERPKEDHLRYETFNMEFKGDFDPFVSKEKEAEYLKKHNIEFVFLPNGSLLVFGHLEVPSRPKSDITFTFPAGSYLDPEGKAGTAHLLEHLFAHDSLMTAQRYGADYFQATTFPERIDINLNGTSSAEIRNYGIWPVIPIVFERIADPTKISLERFEKEKQNIILERKQKLSDWHWHSRRFITTTVLDEINPTAKSFAKQEEEVLLVTLEDAMEMTQQRLVSQNFLVQAQSYGRDDIKEALKDELVDRVRNFPRTGIRSERVDPALFAKINPNYRNGEIYEKDIPIAHDQIVIAYNFQYPTQVFSFESMAQNTLMQIIGMKLFEYARREGISYDARAHMNILGYSQNLSEMTIQVPKIEGYRSFAKSLYNAIKKEVIEKTREDIPHGMEMIRSNAKIEPAANDVFEKIVNVYNAYGRIIDLEKERAWLEMFSEEDLNRELDKLLSINPAIFITGDLE